MAINRYQELKTATVDYELNLSSQFPLISVEELLQLMDDSFGNKDYLHSLDILLYLRRFSRNHQQNKLLEKQIFSNLRFSFTDEMDFVSRIILLNLNFCRYDQAKELLIKANVRWTSSATLTALSGLIALNDGNLISCEKSVLSVLSVDPNHVIALSVLARLQTKLKKFDDALYTIQKADSSTKSLFDWAPLTAEVLVQKNDFVEANKFIEKSLTSNVNESKTFIVRGLQNYKIKMHKRAADDFALAVFLQPINQSIWNLAIKLNLAVGNVKQSLELIDTIANYTEKDEYIKNYLSLIHETFIETIEITEFLSENPKISPLIKEFLITKQSNQKFKKPFASDSNRLEKINDKLFKDAIKLHNKKKYNQAISFLNTIKPHSRVNPYILFNLSLSLLELGQLSKAIDSLLQLLKLHPKFELAWNQLTFLVTYYNFDDTELTYSQFETTLDAIPCQHLIKSVIRCCSQNSRCEEVVGLTKETGSSKKHHRRDSLPGTPANILKDKSFSYDNIIALKHFGRSGTGLLHSLLDNHSQISTVPSIFFSEFFNPLVFEKLQDSDGKQFFENFSKIYEIFYQANTQVTFPTKIGSDTRNFAKLEGLLELGVNKNEVYQIDRTAFLNEAINLYDTLENKSVDNVFSVIHRAYDKLSPNPSKKNTLFYHIHNPSLISEVNFVSHFTHAKMLLMVRDPIISCESWIAEPFAKNNALSVVVRIINMINEVNCPQLFSDSRSLKLEDLKLYPVVSLQKLCAWMNIDFDSSLLEMTVCGKKWWGDPTSPAFQIDGFDPFGKSAISRRFNIFSSKDIERLSPFFEKFCIEHNYEYQPTANFDRYIENFNKNLHELFDFEVKLAHNLKLTVTDYKKLGSFKLFRLGLRQQLLHLSSDYKGVQNLRIS